mmetsp:Transcript_12224/g.23099  ORF Transcript_12224/g.23099 Transcript_12224/m.23099 type:complete len:290 (-) Transcript_12224:6-875(-)
MSAFVCTTYVQSLSKTFSSDFSSRSIWSQKSSAESRKICVARPSACLLAKKAADALSKIFPDSVDLRSLVPIVFLPETAVPTTPPKAWSRFLSCSVNTNWFASSPMRTKTSPNRLGTYIRNASPCRALMFNRTASNGCPLSTSCITWTMFAHGGKSSSLAPSGRCCVRLANTTAAPISSAAKAAIPPTGKPEISPESPITIDALSKPRPTARKRRPSLVPSSFREACKLDAKSFEAVKQTSTNPRTKRPRTSKIASGRMAGWRHLDGAMMASSLHEQHQLGLLTAISPC